MKQAATWAEFVARTREPSAEFLAQIAALARKPNTAGLILFENQMLDSSQCGAQSVVCYGPARTYTSPADVDGKWLNDLPSQRQYPVMFVDCTDKAVVTDIVLPEPAPLGNIAEFRMQRLDSYELELLCPFCQTWVKAWLPGVAANGKVCTCGAKFDYRAGTAERNWQPAADATKVIFRKWPGDGNVIALFPEEPGDSKPGTCSSYMHIGQHAAASILLMKDDTVPATPTEYAGLVAELESIGYKLDIHERISQKMHNARRRAFAKVG